MIKRFENNPIFKPEDVKPSIEGWSVEGVYNPGAFMMNDEYYLLLRIIEKPIMKDENIIGIPMLRKENDTYKMTIKEFSKNDPYVDYKTDPRFLYYKGDTYDVIYSHLRLAKSKDGKNFILDDKPTFCSEDLLTVYGIHDPRVLYLDGEWNIFYSGNSEWGTPTFRATTKDWIDFEQKGVMFPPDNKDVCVFPEKINGKYVAIHRPAAAYFECYNMWLAYSPDMTYWGEHKPLAGIRRDKWDSKRIGCGAEPIKTKEGWLLLYHGSDGVNYYTGALLLDLEDPSKVIGRSEEPFMIPETDYEKDGFFSNVVFVNGHILVNEDLLYIYYGGADRITAGCEVKIKDILKSLKRV